MEHSSLGCKVGADGSGLERIKAEARLKVSMNLFPLVFSVFKVQGLWILGESLQLKERVGKGGNRDS